MKQSFHNFLDKIGFVLLLMACCNQIVYADNSGDSLGFIDQARDVDNDTLVNVFENSLVPNSSVNASTTTRVPTLIPIPLITINLTNSTPIGDISIPNQTAQLNNFTSRFSAQSFISNTSSTGNSQVISTPKNSWRPDIQQERKITDNDEAKEKMKAIAPILQRKMNMSSWQRKISSDLFQITDLNYPDTATHLRSKKETMKKMKQLIPAEIVAPTINNPKSSAQPLGDTVYVSIILNKSGNTDVIKPYLTQVIGRDAKYTMYAWVNLNNIEKLASLDEIISVKTILPPISHIGSVTTEGDTFLNSDDVRNTYRLTGQNVKVGIISRGVSHISDSKATGDLPQNVKVLADSSDSDDEGTAMLEIVHDIAPDAELYFHTSGGDVNSFNHAVDDLIAWGCTIICDDIGHPGEPYFEDGDEDPATVHAASHLKSVLRQHPDVIYISSAGNEAMRHYQGIFYDDNSGQGFHDFSSGSSNKKNLYIHIPAGRSVFVYLQWNDKWFNSNNDYDLYLYTKQNGIFEQLAYSATSQNGAGSNPVELIVYTNDRSSNIDAQIDIQKAFSSTQAKTLEVYIYPIDWQITIDQDNIISQDSISSQSALSEVITVSALNAGDYWHPGEVIEPTSSQGPVSISFPTQESRQKPDISGMDNVVVSGAGGFSSPFVGTSAAAPHIAGVVALAKQANPSLTRNQIQNYLYTTALDLGPLGRDNTFGYGRANALKMIQTINLITPTSTPTLTSTPTPTITLTPPPPNALVADFTAIPVSGTAPLAVQFIDRSTNTPTSWSWDFGDGQRQIGNQYQPVHLYSNAGTYTVSLTAINSAGSDTKTRSNLITITSPPMNNRVQNSDCNSVLYWTAIGDSGSGGAWYPARYVPYEGESGGYIQLDVNGALSGWANSAIYQDIDLTNVNTLTYYLMTKGSSSTGDKRIDVYIDDVRIKTITSPSGLTKWTQYSHDISGYSGIHRIKFYTSISNSGSGGWLKVGVDTVSAIAEINPPVASFTQSRNSGTVPFSVIFTDTSTNTPTSWAWDFGDDGTSTVQNPSHRYTSIGTYTVKLTAANIAGSNTQIKTGHIIASNIPEYTPTPTPHVTETLSPIPTEMPAQIDSYTKALLHFNGADQGIIITDETGKTWTKYGNAKLSSSNKKFGSASGSFDGSGDYLASPASSDFTFETGDWTVDCWVNFNSVSTINTIVSSPSSGSDNKFVIWQEGYSNQIMAYIGGVSIASSWSPQTNQWYHIEVSREGSVVRIFIDGLQVTSATQSANLDFSQVYLGKYGSSSNYMMNGYIDEFRISKSISRHSSNFNPESGEYGSSTPTPTPAPTPTISPTPTPQVTETLSPTPTEMPAQIDSYTKALLHFNGADQGIIITDETGKLWGVYGDAKLRTSPVKFGSASESFDGSGDYLASPASSDFTFGTGDWTVDCWVNFNSVSSINTIVSSPSSGNDNKFVIWQDGYSNQITVYVGGISITSSWTPQTNRWYHIEVSRESTIVRIFIDGVQVTSATRSTNLDFSQVYIGKYGSSSSYLMNGYIDELRISKGIARHTSYFSPALGEYGSSTPTPTPTPKPTMTLTSTPTVTETPKLTPTETPAPIDLYTKALLHFNGADQITSFVDETGKTWGVYGDAQLRTSPVKFGSASGSFDGSGDYLASPASSDFTFGTGDWTVDCWVNFNSVSSINTIVSSPSSGSDNKFVIWQDGYSNQIMAYVGGVSINSRWTPQTNRWYHIEGSREGSVVRIFIDGLLVTSATRSANLDFSQVYIGKYGSSSNYMMNGYIDELRISKGIARHSSEFKPQEL